ncbi:hypothetical protein PV08_05863 [Exophiala spinifera]|uniref:Calpain catalytic domain-containing protein n=1 Tax=Exophiala spinifera TaxID=91928 RepID=A0A0D2B9Y3_9EURO|nr:uncharacterized protein PV08_05863 [Exophiala spinifera]KIW15813.1 hypothetical protein PV08_05863 [Exophiala spinifera]
MDDRRDLVGGRYYGPPPPEIAVAPPPKPRRKIRHQSPQETVRQFWDKLNTKYPGKVFTVLPDNPYARKKAARRPRGVVSGQRAAKSYEEARRECERDVDRIIRECRRLNQKYRDPHFDIEWDLKSGQRNCLDGLSNPGDSMKPKGVKRVTDIFENPQFYINGPTAGDVRQGRDGDCYLMAALCGLGNMKGLIDKICVKHDMQVGVYGFVFFRDGEWQHTIVDDKLYLRAPDYDEAREERDVWDDINRVDSAEEYRKAHQTGSRALYFAQCSDENETWLPLLEKAYAKAHGDFASIDGGFTGEAIEDLTGGVTTEVYSTDILDREAFWRDELMQVGKQFLFGCATGFYSNWLDTSVVSREREGISEGHAYSIMDAREVKGERLLKLRNPWGKKEWTGKWSDGSAEWNAEWMELLDHKFGNDGVFWISYDDLLKKYQHFDRTRIFGPGWNVTQCWTSVNVSWSSEYHSTRFSLTLEENAPVVIVLAQLDDTYFGGLEGGYGFDLQFRLESDDKEDDNDYIVRSNGNYAMARSVSTDIELEKGTYSVLMRITATRNTDKDHLEDVLPVYAATRREKLIQMGLSYDLAHAKGVYVESESEKAERKRREKAQRVKDREKLKQKMKKQAEKDWKRQKERHRRDKEMLERDRRRKARKQNVNGAMEQPEGPVGENIEDGQIAEQFIVVNEQKSEHQQKDSNAAVEETGPKHAEVIAIGEGTRVGRKADKTDEILEPISGLETIREKEDAPTSSAEPIVESLETVIRRVEKEAGQANKQELAPAASNEAKHEQQPVNSGGGAVNTSRQTEREQNATEVSNSTTKVMPTLSAAPERLRRGTHNNTSQVPTRYPRRSDTLDTTAAVIDTGSGAGEESLPNGAGETYIVIREASRDNIDELSEGSFPPFDWNTDIDMSPEESWSSDESSSSSLRMSRYRSVRRRRRPSRRGTMPVSPPPVLDVVERSDDGGEGPEEQWNAVCVVGLRVYSTLSGDGIRLKVLTPREKDDEGEGNIENGDDPTERGVGGDGTADETTTAEVKLDPDDISKGAFAVDPESKTSESVGRYQADAETGKKSDELEVGTSWNAQKGKKPIKF